MIAITRKPLTILLLSSLIAAAVFAEESKEPTPTPFPKSGSLGSSIQGGFGGIGAAGQWGTEGAGGKEANPISGSVSQVSGRWIARIYNNSKDSYSASVELQQFSDRGTKVKGDYYTLSLKPGESVERSAPVATGSRNANLEMKSWRKTSKEAAPVATATPVTK